MLKKYVVPYLYPRAILLAVLLGLLVGGCGFLIDFVIHKADRLFASDFYTFLIATFFSYILLLYEKRRRVILARRMKTAAEVNHHIRNALTAVVFSASVRNDPQLAAVLEDATARIDWVLNSVLPDGTEALKWPVQAPDWKPASWQGGAGRRSEEMDEKRETVAYRS